MVAHFFQNPARVFCVIVVLLLLALAVPAAGVADDFVLQLAPGADIAAVSADYQLAMRESIPALNLYRVGSLDATTAAALAADARTLSLAPDAAIEARPSYIIATGDLLEAHPSYIIATGVSPDAYHQQAAALQVRLDEAQTLAQGAGTVVAVLDTGVDMDHPMLDGRLLPGYDFVDDDALPEDVGDGLDNDGDGSVDEAIGHGSHVAGIVTLVAPEAMVLPVRVFESDGTGTYFAVAAGIVYAVDQGADVINLSGSGTETTPGLEAAIAYAQQQGVVVVAAAGPNHIGYPAAYEDVVSVGAVDEEDYRLHISYFDNGDVTAYAPGDAILSAYADGDYAIWTGHSMAAPFVAGEAALLRSTGGCDAACTQAAIAADTQPVQQWAGSGRIDPFDAVAEVTGQTSAAVQALYRTGNGDRSADDTIRPLFDLANAGNSLPLESLTLRYWYRGGAGDDIAVCDYAAVGCENLVTTVGTTTDSNGRPVHYLEIGFAPGTGRLSGLAHSGEIQMRLHQPDWSKYDETDDYSYAPSRTFSANEQVTLYANGNLVWGLEP